MSWDRDLLLLINGGLASPALTWLMRIVTDVHNWIPVLILASIALLWMGRTRPVTVWSGKEVSRASRINPRVVLVCLVIAVALSDQISCQIKHNVSRSRPCRDEVVSEQIESRWHVSGNRSFPSSHAANSAALATVVSLAYPAVAIPACLLSLAVGFSRVYLGVHYPLDVAVGWLIGFLSGGLVWVFMRKAARKRGIIGLANRFRVRQPRAGMDPGQPWKTVGFDSADGYHLRGFLMEGGRNEQLVLLVHGLGGDIAGMLTLATIFMERGYDCFLVPLRGHDNHPCEFTTGGPGEASDVMGAIFAMLKAGYAPDRILVYGCSMGGAAAIKAVAILGGKHPGGVLCHGTYTGFFSAARNRIGPIRTCFLRMMMPMTSVQGLMHFNLDFYLGLCPEETPIVFMSGTRDRICTPEMTEHLAMTAPNGRSITIENSPHPVWLDSGIDRTLMGAALDAAIGFIDGSLTEKKALLDESGNLHIVR
jgi:membrane-associated phospholipid phosphatase